MIALQESILHLEELLLRDKEPNYPAFAVQVPKELVDFVQEDPADIFFIAYEDVFKLYTLNSWTITWSAYMRWMRR